jgi:hypothetical protein
MRSPLLDPRNPILRGIAFVVLSMATLVLLFATLWCLLSVVDQAVFRPREPGYGGTV